MWDVNAEEEAPRADFKGDLTPSLLDKNVQELTDDSKMKLRVFVLPVKKSLADAVLFANPSGLGSLDFK